MQNPVRRRVASPSHPIFWSVSAIEHVEKRHGFEEDEVWTAGDDPHRIFVRARRGRYIFIGQGRGGRLPARGVGPRADQFL